MKKLLESIRYIPREFRKRGFLIVVNVFIKSLINFAGIAVLLGVILLVLSNAEYKDYTWIIAVLGVLFLVLKNVVVVKIQTMETEYLLSLYRFYSAKLLKSHYNRGLLTIKQSGVGKLTYDVNAVCYGYVTSVLSPLLHVIGEMFLLMMITIALLVIYPKVLGITLVVFLPILLCYVLIVRKKMTYYGKMTNEAKRKQWKVVEETFKGFAEIEVYQAYDLMVGMFTEQLGKISDNYVKSQKLGMMPRILVEVGIAVALLLVILFVDDVEHIKLVLGVFAVSAFKVLPGFTKMIGAWLQVKGSDYAVDTILEIEHDIRDDDKSGLSEEGLMFRESINAEGLVFRYSENGAAVIDGLNVEIKKGEIVGLQGVSGSGKSTLFNLLQGFYFAQEGGVYIDGVKLEKGNSREWQRQIGYVPQDVFIKAGSVAENVALSELSELIDKEKVAKILRSVLLGEWVESLEEGLEQVLSDVTISGGQKQRIGIARALYKGADVIFLDEATSSLDNDTEGEILDVVRRLSDERRDVTMVIIAHRDSTLEICDRVINLNKDCYEV